MLGYLEEFPDYLTQGESLLELEENLRDLRRDLTSVKFRCVKSGRVVHRVKRTDLIRKLNLAVEAVSAVTIVTTT